MFLKERNYPISFLNNYPLLNKYTRSDQDHRNTLKLPKSLELSEKHKLSILSDSMFKAMFMNSKRLKYSCKLISYFLDISYEELLSHLTFGKNELDKDVEKDKGQRCDYVAYIKNSVINIEINSNGAPYIIERNLDYVDHLFSKNIKVGNKYQYIQVIQFNINHFSYIGEDKIKCSYYISDEKNIALSNKKIIIHIFVPNLIKKLYNEGIEKLTEAERFLLVIILPDIEETRKIAKGDAFMSESIDEAISVSRNNDLREAYDKEWALRDLGYIEGKEDGFHDGKFEGIKEGIKEGIEQIACNLKRNGFPIEMISTNTGLSIEQINKL